MKLWVVGKIDPDNYLVWDFQGVFDDEAKAVAACQDENWFVGPAILNVTVPEEIPWPDAYYPLQ